MPYSRHNSGIGIHYQNKYFNKKIYSVELPPHWRSQVPLFSTYMQYKEVSLRFNCSFINNLNYY
jgi:hypothetical protein